MRIPNLRDKALRKWLIVLGLGAIGTFQYHVVQFATRFDTFFGDRGDVRGFVYFMEHWYQALRGQANLLSPGIFYPTKGTLAYSDLLVGFAVPYSFLRALGFEMFAAVEVMIIALAFATYLVCFVLLHKVLRFHVVAACAGALFFAYSSPKFFQTGHLQLQFIICIPAIFIFVILLYQQSASISPTRAAVYLSLASFFFLLQLVTTFYYAWFLAVWSVLFAIPLLLLPSSRRRAFELARKHFKAILLSGVVFLAGFIPFVLLYLRTVRVGTWYSYQNVAEMIPSWWALFSMGDGNYIWGWLAGRVRPEPWPATWGELMIGVGLVPSLVWLILSGVALWFVVRDFQKERDAAPDEKERRATRAIVAALILATTAFLIIGFKYWGGRSPWYFVYQFFPGAGAIRAMSRYVIFLTMPLAIILAYAAHMVLSWASKKSRRQRVFISAAVCVMLGFAVFEQFGRFKIGGTGFSTRAEKAYLQAMAAKLPPGCEAFYITPGPNGKHNPFEYQYDAMLISIISGVPTINASSSQFPPHWHTMYDVRDPLYETHVQSWVNLHGLRGKICRLEVGPQFEAFDVSAPGPLDDPAIFVRQQYLDFAAREPNPEELSAYVARLQNCQPHDGSCKRETISSEIFRNSGFADNGSFIFRLYQIAFARPPRYAEFTSDLAAVRGSSNLALFLEGFLDREESLQRYSTISDTDFVAKLAEHTEGSLSDATRQTLAGKSRAQTLFVIAGDSEVTRKFANRAFVTLHYFGYLHRDPESGGYDQWLRLLDNTGDHARVTSGFVNSLEYRRRFFQ